MSKPSSPACKLVELVWEHAADRSWTRLNHSMQDALSVAIKAGLRFEPDDLAHFWNTMRGGYWFTGAANEWIHTLAVRYDNTSAAVAYEKWAGRGPFFLEGRRLHIGSSVDFKHIGIEPLPAPSCAVVTSFHADGQSINVCVYADHAPDPRFNNMPSGRPVKRVRLTLERVREVEKERKAAIKAAKKDPA